MQAFLCDICTQTLSGEAYEWQSRAGQVISTQEGPPRMRGHRDLQMRLICVDCNDWITLAFDRLLQAHTMKAS